MLSSTMSFQGGNSYADTVLQGAIMTGVFNYGVTTMAVGEEGGGVKGGVTTLAAGEEGSGIK